MGRRRNGKIVQQAHSAFQVFFLVRQQARCALLRHQRIGPSLHLTIEANRPVRFLAKIGDAAEIVQCVHAEVTGVQQVLEIGPCRVEIAGVKVNDRHQSQGVPLSTMLEHYLAKLAQRIVGPIGHHVHNRQFDTRIGIGVGSVAHQPRRVLDGFVDLS